MSSLRFDSFADPQQGQLSGAAMTTRSRGKWSGNGLREGRLRSNDLTVCVSAAAFSAVILGRCHFQVFQLKCHRSAGCRPHGYGAGGRNIGLARMEDVLDLYGEAPDPKRPVVCFDESPIQLIGEVRQPIPATRGQIERYDCEYRRNGTANLFVFLDVNRPWRG